MFTGDLITMLQVKRDFFSPEPFRVLLADIIFFPQCASHSASNSRVSEVLKMVLTFLRCQKCDGWQLKMLYF